MPSHWNMLLLKVCASVDFIDMSVCLKPQQTETVGEKDKLQ